MEPPYSISSELLNEDGGEDESCIKPCIVVFVRLESSEDGRYEEEGDEPEEGAACAAQVMMIRSDLRRQNIE